MGSLFWLRKGETVLGDIPAVRCGAGMEARWGDLERLGGGLAVVADLDPERARDAWDMEWGLVKGPVGEDAVTPR